MPLPGGPVDHRAHEVAEVGYVAHANRGDLSRKSLARLRPDVLGHEDARAGRALLALVLEAAADDGRRQRIHVSAGVGHDEVLAAGLAHHARIILVAGDALADDLPHAL